MTTSEPVLCPHCIGAGRSGFIACGPQGAHSGVQFCRTCEGTGHVSAELAERIAEGRRWRQDRIDRRLSQREEAERLGISPVELSKLENVRA